MPPAWRSALDGRRVVQLVALLLAVAASSFLALVPVYSGAATSTSSDGTVTTTQQTATLLEVNGPGALAVLLVPVLLTAVPALWFGRGRTPAAVVGTALLALGCVAGLLTVGVFYLPALVAAGLAFAARTRSARPEKPGGPVAARLA